MNRPACILLAFILLVFSGCMKDKKSDGPYFGNGFRNGWADQHSVTLWTRLTESPEMNREGRPFIPINTLEHNALRYEKDIEKLHAAQIPQGLTLNDMEGACPGGAGEIRLVYYPAENPTSVVETAWTPVDTLKNYTTQWKLNGLTAGTEYHVEIYARKGPRYLNSDTIAGVFRTPPAEDLQKDIRFAIVTCHDYNRRDDKVNGHKVYPSIQRLNPDFFVHTGDVEYYDKPNPWAMTEPMMYFKWDRLFALPYQRDFFNKVTTYFMKDDHDILSDDAYPGMTYGAVTFDRGIEIFDKEQFPSNDLPYKTIRWGKDLQVWIMEGRNFRSKNDDPDGPGKTIWGSEQKAWLRETIEKSDAAFKLIITPTPVLGPDRTSKGDNHSNAAFQYEGDEIRSFINQFDNVFICNGDRHWQYVTHHEGTNLWEFSCGSMSDEHAGGWNQEKLMPEHRFLRVAGGFLMGHVFRDGDKVKLQFTHHDVDGNVVHEEMFERLTM